MTTTKNKKKMGRPLAFDKDKALLAAINVFWSKGYEGTSMKDLTTAMNINAPSLYSSFGDKHQLYLQAIDRYTTNDACAPLLAFESEENITKAVCAFFRAALQYATEHESGAQGCFLSNCVSTSAGEIEGTQSRLKQAIEETDIKLAQRFDKEKQTGRLRPDFPSLERARLMFDIRQGYVLRARAGIAVETMTNDIESIAVLVVL